VRIDPEYIEVKRVGSEEGDDAWLITYADVITLVLCFFIILVAVSTVDPFAIQRISESFKMARGESTEQVKKYSMDILESTVESALFQTSIEGQVTIKRDQRGLVAKISDASVFSGEDRPLFLSGEPNLTNHGKAMIRNLVQQVIDFPFQIAIEGHTDDNPIRTARFPSNWELSASRANSVLRYMAELGINEKNMRVIAFGETRPLSAFPNRTISGQAIPLNQKRNRRVEIIFLNERAEFSNR